MGYYSKEVQQSNTCPLKKSRVSIVFAKNSSAENIQQSNNSAQAIMTLPVWLSNKQTYLTNAFQGKSVKIDKRSGQWERQICFEKTQKSQHASQLIGVPLIGGKEFEFRKRTQKRTLCPQKIRKMKITNSFY